MQVQGTGSPNFAMGAQNSTNALKKTNRELQKILERLSTATRINRASDDAAGLGVSEQLRTQIRGFKMAQQNVSDAMSAINISDGAGKEVTELLQRQRELTIAARNDTLTDRDRAALDAEYQQLGQEIARLADSTEFNGQGVSAGEELASGNAQIQAGPNAEDQVSLPLVDLRSVSLGINGTSLATGESATIAMNAINGALTELNTQRSTLGATFNKLESTQNNLSVAMINTQAAESVLRDEDMAKGLAELTRARLLQEGSTRAFSRFNEISQNHLLGLLQ